MGVQKEPARIIYEMCLGRSIPKQQWNELKQQLSDANLSLTTSNLRTVAKCKKLAPRTKISAKAIENVMGFLAENHSCMWGGQVMDLIKRSYPGIPRYVFYRAFHGCGMRFSLLGTYSHEDIAKVIYKLSISKFKRDGWK